MCAVKQYGQMVSQTSLNPVHFFTSLHSLAIEVRPSVWAVIPVRTSMQVKLQFKEPWSMVPSVANTNLGAIENSYFPTANLISVNLRVCLAGPDMYTHNNMDRFARRNCAKRCVKFLGSFSPLFPEGRVLPYMVYIGMCCFTRYYMCNVSILIHL